MRDNSYEVAKSFDRTGKYEVAKRFRTEAAAFQMAMWLLTDKEYFDSIYEIYKNNINV